MNKVDLLHFSGDRHNIHFEFFEMCTKLTMLKNIQAVARFEVENKFQTFFLPS